MARYTKQTVTSIAGMNAELTKVQTAVQDTLSRKGDVPNQMEATLDMNSNRIINLVGPVSPNEPVRLQDLEDIIANLCGEQCALVGGDLGSVQEAPQQFVDFGSISNPAQCFQDLGFLPSVLNLEYNTYVGTVADLDVSGNLVLPFEFSLDQDDLDVTLMGSIVDDYTKVNTNTINFASAVLDEVSSDTVLKIKHRYVQLN